jgi:hypothetical protein
MLAAWENEGPRCPFKLKGVAAGYPFKLRSIAYTRIHPYAKCGVHAWLMAARICSNERFFNRRKVEIKVGV